MKTRNVWLAAMVGALTVGCVGPDDDPSNVRDLRVLGIRLDPPELMAAREPSAPPNVLSVCPLDSAVASFLQPVQFTALVIDPKGAGRSLEYTLAACAWPGDRKCETVEDRVLLESGAFAPGEFTRTLNLAPLTLPERNNQLLLEQVYEQDTYKGLGGLRMPLMLQVSAGGEVIYAQKLMVFGCEFFSGMQRNVSPVLPGITLEGTEWAEGSTPLIEGIREHDIEVLDVSALEEDYVVPSFEGAPIQLKESWKISWHTDVGRVAPGETGGVDLGGQASRHRVQWLPPSDSVEQDVNIWAVVRDGRGGQSWIHRTAHFKP